MTTSKIYLSIIGVVIIAALAWWIIKTPASEEPASETPSTATSTETVASTTPTSTGSNSAPVAPFISREDTLTSWDTHGSQDDNGPKEAVARKTIAELSAKLGGTNDFSLHIALAQEYDHIGEGKLVYDQLALAIASDPHETSGVAWHNLGVLMERLGAYHTARFAHEQAVRIQPELSGIQISRLELMVYHFPKDTAGIEKAFRDAEAILGANSSMLLDFRARWKAVLAQ